MSQTRGAGPGDCWEGKEGGQTTGQPHTPGHCLSCPHDHCRQDPMRSAPGGVSTPRSQRGGGRHQSGSRNPTPRCASGTCFPKVAFYQVNSSIKTTHRSRSALVLWFLFPLLPCVRLLGLFSCVRVCMCFSVMRNADSAGREIAGWEPIASTDKAQSRASARAQPGPPSRARLGQGPKRAQGRAPAAHFQRAGEPGWGGGRPWEAGLGRPPFGPRPRAPPPPGRSWRVKMRALIVTKRRRPRARPLPAAVRRALAAVCPPRWPHLRPGRGRGGEGAEPWGRRPPRPHQSRGAAARASVRLLFRSEIDVPR